MIASFVLFMGLAIAAPAPQRSQPPAEGRLAPQTSNMITSISGMLNAKGELDAGLRPLIRNQVIDSTQCGKVIFIFARASMEPNNMGGSMGPWVCAGLKKQYGEAQVLCQGVSSATFSSSSGYSASITDNVGGIMTSRSAVAEANKMFTHASEKCPKAAITFGGYSQGTAVMHATVGKLPEAIKSKVVGGVLFGDTRNVQDRGQVPGYPADKVKVFCPKEDGVCLGGLYPTVTNGHFVYPFNRNGDEAVDFLKGKIGS